MKFNYNPLRNRLSLTAFLVLVIFSANSCKKDDQTIGLGLQPAGDALSVFQDSVSFTPYLYMADSIRTDEITEAYLGNYFDEQFGQSRTVFYGQLELPGNNLDLGLPEDLILDSVVLSMRTTQRILGSLEEQSFSVFEIDQDLYKDSVYYSNETATLFSQDLVVPGRDVVSITNASNISRGDSVNFTVEIPLINEVGQRFLDENDSGNLDDDESFQSFFKGLAIQSNTDDGGVFGIVPDDGVSGVNLYYRDFSGEEVDTLSVTFQFDNNSAYFNYVERDYSSSVFGVVSEPLLLDDKVYLQGISGSMAELRIEEFPLEIIGNEELVLSSAKLILPLADIVNDKYPTPSSLYLSTGTSRDSLKIVEDQIFGITIDGTIDSDLQAYVFNLPLHFQNVVLGSTDVEPLWLSVNPPERLRDFLDNSSFFSRLFLEQRRVILNGPASNSQNMSENMRLILTYSE